MLIWQPDSTEIVVVVFFFTVLYLIYHYGLLTALVKRILTRSKKGEINQPAGIFIHRISGVFLLGILPFCIVTLALGHSPSEYGLSFRFSPVFLLTVPVVCGILFPILLQYSKTPEANRYAPEVKPQKWTSHYIVWNTLGWIVYLFAYEFCMRGFLLFSLVRFTDNWTAIFLMTSMYTLIHLTRGKGEAASTMVMGILFGVISVYTNSIVLPFIIHAFAALTTDYLLIRRIRQRVEPGFGKC
jgi:membrane protease YdiL (CAAX protease family)